MTEYSMQAKLITEFIGTFFLTLTICTAAAFGTAGSHAPFAIASTLMVMIYAGGHVSGAHYNPAVTVSIYMRGACEKSDVAPYIASQVAAGVAAALVASNVLMPDADVATMTMDTSPALAAELMFTFALAYVILNVATSESTEGNGYYGAAIAFVVLAGALTVGPISGASFNPAVTASLVSSGVLEAADSWIHIAPQLVGGALAALVFNSQRE
tara:strand:+ start:4353 stop:4991 length:639 start_codon:yes stop_codon:yes gene_type:complete